MNDRAPDREMANIWSALRRRKVFQWGLVYGAAAWGFLQGLEYLSGTYDWPRQIQQFTTLALLIGLPIVLVLAWYHGDRGQQRISTPEFAILTLLLLLGGGAFWYFQRTSETSTVAAQPTSATATFAPEASIAVLPFVNMSADKDQEYFADGISEELLNMLAKIPELKVIARTSSFAFKGKDVDIADIATKLNVAHVLEGSLRKSGNRVRITAQLVRAADSARIWSETYDRKLDDVFVIQDEIAGAVVEQLQIELLGAAPKARPVDPRVHPLLLQAEALADEGSPEAGAMAIELYQRALGIVREEPRAWSGLGRVYLNQANRGELKAAEGRRLAGEALEKALALDPDDALTLSRLGVALAQFDHDLAGAALRFEQALALDPNNVTVVANAALFTQTLGRLDQAIALHEYVVSRDPASAQRHGNLGGCYYQAGRWDDAIASLRASLTLSPNRVGGRLSLGQALLLKGEGMSALAEMQAEPDDWNRLVGLALAEYTVGRQAASDSALRVLIAQYRQDWAIDIAMVYAWRLEVNRAFEWLDRAVANEDWMSWIIKEPIFAPLHDDPRWLPLLRKLGMAPEQLAAIKFDVTVPKR